MNVQNPRFPLFDSLRAIAALSVLFFHTAFVLHQFTRPGVGHWAVQLNIGVTIFFLISGFLLYRPFVQARYSGAPRPRLIPYAIRRVARIVPAYWVALTLIALWLGLDAVFTAGNAPVYYGFAQVYSHHTLLAVTLRGGIGHAWTLCVEMSFYVLLPLWAMLQRRAPARSTRGFAIAEALPLLAIFAAGVAWNYTQIQSTGGIVDFTSEIATLPAFLDHFALGMGLAVASVILAGRERQPLVVRAVERAPWAPWLLAGAAFVVLCNVGSGVDTIDGEATRHLIRGVVALFLLLPAVFGDDRGGWVRRLLADRRLQWVGLVSYSLYLWHPAVLAKLADAHVDRPLGGPGYAVVGLVACLAVAAVSFYLIERPALRLGRRLAGRYGYQEPEGPPSGAVPVDRPGAPAIDLAGPDRAATGAGGTRPG
ncbi:MAG TPA: acyltransferase [Thermoleophilaceae bacterium]